MCVCVCVCVCLSLPALLELRPRVSQTSLNVDVGHGCLWLCSPVLPVCPQMLIQVKEITLLCVCACVCVCVCLFSESARMSAVVN